MSKVKLLMERFCQEALTELNSYDTKLRNRIIRGETGNPGNFYSYHQKGLSIYSITEPIIKWLIFTSLIDRYCMLPEHWTSSGKYLDMALYSYPDSVNQTDSPRQFGKRDWLNTCVLAKVDGKIYRMMGKGDNTYEKIVL